MDLNQPNEAGKALTHIKDRARANHRLAQIAQQCGEDLVLLPAEFETTSTLAYAYQTAAYLATGDFTQALAGNGPIMVSKLTGAVELAGTALPVEIYVQDFEARVAAPSPHPTAANNGA